MIYSYNGELYNKQTTRTTLFTKTCDGKGHEVSFGVKKGMESDSGDGYTTQACT